MRGAGNIIEAGSRIKGLLALNSIAEYKVAGEENSPIKFNLKKTNLDYYYAIKIFDDKDEEKYNGSFRSTNDYEFAFTPLKTTTYTIRITGTKKHGKYDIKLSQLSLDSQLRGAGNVIEVGSRVKGLIALNSIAEYKYDGEKNKPLKLKLRKTNTDYYYRIQILDNKSNQVYKKDFRSTNDYKIEYTPLESGNHTIRLIGTSKYGKYDIEVKK